MELIDVDFVMFFEQFLFLLQIQFQIRRIFLFNDCGKLNYVRKAEAFAGFGEIKSIVFIYYLP
jgi:hypothetical protein